MPDELERLALNGRATDSQFAQNPIPIARAMGQALALLHSQEVPADLRSRTEQEIGNVRDALASGEPLPAVFSRVRPESIEAMIDAPPKAPRRVVTHGSPVVSAAVLVDSVVTFEPAGTVGFDPPERDLAIVVRSIAETFTSEVARPFLEGYEANGGQLPRADVLDWYSVLAAFR